MPPGAVSRHLHLQRLCRIIPQNINHLDHDRILAPRRGRLVLVTGPQLERLVFAGAVSLPHIVKGVALVVPIHSPVINPLRPVGDGGLDIGGNIIGRDDEIGEFDGHAKPVRSARPDRFIDLD